MLAGPASALRQHVPAEVATIKELSPAVATAEEIDELMISLSPESAMKQPSRRRSEIYDKKDFEDHFRLRDDTEIDIKKICLLYTSPSPRDGILSRMPSSA